MGKFRQISIHSYCPWLTLEIGFHSLSLAFFSLIFFKLGIRVDIREECLGIADG